MSRKKSDTQIDVELDSHDGEDLLEASDDNETPIEDPEVTQEINLKPTTAPKRRRTPQKRAPKEPVAHPLNTLAKSESEKDLRPEPVAMEAGEIATETVTAVLPRRSRKAPAPAGKAEPDLGKKFEMLEKQWAVLEEQNASLVQQLKESKNEVEKPPAASPPSLELSSSSFVTAKVPTVVTQKVSPLTRVAAVASFVAFILSLVSLSLSQTARQAALSAQVASTVGLNDNKNLSRFSSPAERTARPQISGLPQPRIQPQPGPSPVPQAVVANHPAPKKKPAMLFPFEMSARAKTRSQSLAQFPAQSPAHSLAPSTAPAAKPHPEIAMRTEGTFKPRAPIILYRRNRSALPRDSN